MLGVPPYSSIGTALALRASLDQLKEPTIRRQAMVTKALARRCLLLRRVEGWPELELHFNLPRSDSDRSERKEALRASLNVVLGQVLPGRIAVHLDLIKGLNEKRYLYNETLDLLSDLVAVGQSESSVYRALERHIIHQEGEAKTFNGQLAILKELGNKSVFWVGIRLRGGSSSRYPNGKGIFIGKGPRSMPAREIKADHRFPIGEDELIAGVRVSAVAGHVAVDEALARLHQHLALPRSGKRAAGVEVSTDDIWLLGPLQGSRVKHQPQRSYRTVQIRDDASALQRAANRSPALAETLNQAVNWLIDSLELEREPAFICIWLSLVNLVGDDRLWNAAPTVAPYLLLSSPELWVEWMFRYLHRAQARDDLARQMGRRRVRTRQMLVEATFRAPDDLKRSVPWSPLFKRRVDELNRLGTVRGQRIALRRIQSSIEPLLAQANVERHSVVHRGRSSVEPIRLVNDYLRSVAVTMLNQMVAVAATTQCTSVVEIHARVKGDLHWLIEQTMEDPRRSVTSVLDRA
jgi:hypothetical protein